MPQGITHSLLLCDFLCHQINEFRSLKYSEFQKHFFESTQSNKQANTEFIFEVLFHCLAAIVMKFKSKTECGVVNQMEKFERTERVCGVFGEVWT